MTAGLALVTVTLNSFRKFRKCCFLCFHQYKFSFKYTTGLTLLLTYTTAGTVG